jgi:hypothetical protein
MDKPHIDPELIKLRQEVYRASLIVPAVPVLFDYEDFRFFGTGELLVCDCHYYVWGEADIWSDGRSLNCPLYSLEKMKS